MTGFNNYVPVRNEPTGISLLLLV